MLCITSLADRMYPRDWNQHQLTSLFIPSLRKQFATHTDRPFGGDVKSGKIEKLDVKTGGHVSAPFPHPSSLKLITFVLAQTHTFCFTQQLSPSCNATGRHQVPCQRRRHHLHPDHWKEGMSHTSPPMHVYIVSLFCEANANHFYTLCSNAPMDRLTGPISVSRIIAAAT